MIEHLLLPLSRYVGNHGHLWPRDYKQVNKLIKTSIMDAHLLLPRRYLGNHAHLWPRDFKLIFIMVVNLFSLIGTCPFRNHRHLWSRYFKLINKCVYSLVSLLPATATTNREYLNSAREYLNPVGEIKVHTQLIFLILKPEPPCNIPTIV